MSVICAHDRCVRKRRHPGPHLVLREASVDPVVCDCAACVLGSPSRRLRPRWRPIVITMPSAAALVEADLRDGTTFSVLRLAAMGKAAASRALERNPRRSWTVSAIQHDPCAYCGRPANTTDHLVPRSHSHHSRRKHDNCARACRRCNTAKAATSVLHFLVERAS